VAVEGTGFSINYTGDAVSTNFTFPFYFVDKDDLWVFKRDTNGSDIVQVRPTDYDVTGTLVDGVYSNGGVVIFSVAPAVGVLILLVRRTSHIQPTSFIEGDPLPAKSLEHSLDRIELQIQEALGHFVGSFDGPPSFSGTVGDWALNRNPVLGGFFGWVWVVEGQWAQFGNITL